MIGKKEFAILAKINATSLVRADDTSHPEEAVAGGGAIIRLIASQVAAFQRLNPDFDARQFMKASGVKEDWLQSRMLGWAAHEYEGSARWGS